MKITEKKFQHIKNLINEELEGVLKIQEQETTIGDKLANKRFNAKIKSYKKETQSSH